MGPGKLLRLRPWTLEGYTLRKTVNKKEDETEAQLLKHPSPLIFSRQIPHYPRPQINSIIFHKQCLTLKQK